MNDDAVVRAVNGESDAPTATDLHIPTAALSEGDQVPSGSSDAGGSGTTTVPLPRNYIGSSDAAMVADLSPWGSPLTVWNRLTGLTPPPERVPLRFYLGRRLEPIILDLYEQQTGKRPAKVIESDDAPPILDRVYPFIGCHPDYQFLEIKTSRSAREWGDESEPVTRRNMTIPLHYFIQVQHIMRVMAWGVMDVAVLIGHDDFKTYTVPHDQMVVDSLVQAEVELWESVQRGEPPARSDKTARAAYLKAKFPDAELPERPATPEELLAVMEWKRAKANLADAKAIEDAAAFRVKSAIGPHAGFSGLVTYKTQHRSGYTVQPSTHRVLRQVGREDDD